MSRKRTDFAEWKTLEAHAREMKKIDLRTLFEQAGRSEIFSLEAGDLLLDYSKNRITQETLKQLLQLAEAVELNRWIESMFTGEKINETENRSVLHTALRAPRETVVEVDGINVIPDVHAVLDQMASFSDQIRSGAWKGYTGKRIKHIVNIGIGGSDLGPVMASEALKPYAQRELKLHFVSNVDGTHIAEALLEVDAEETLLLWHPKHLQRKRR